MVGAKLRRKGKNMKNDEIIMDQSLHDSQIRMAEENYKTHLRLSERHEAGRLKLIEKQEEADIAARKEINIYLEKKFIAERYQTLKKAEIECIASDETGSLVVIRKNALVDLGPQGISNMISPKLVKMRCISDPDKFCYRLTCTVGGEKREVYLRADKISEVRYVTRKLASAGVVLYGSGKKLLPEIFAYLISRMSSDDVELVNDRTGWFLNLQKKLCFGKEEGLTWTRIENLCK